MKPGWLLAFVALIAFVSAEKPTPSAGVFDSPEFLAKVAVEQDWLASLSPADSRPMIPGNSTRVSMRVESGDGQSHNIVVCSANEDNPLTCKFTAPSTANYYFVFNKAHGLAVSIIGAVSIDHVYVGEKVFSYWNNCCDSRGGPGNQPCKWDDLEVVRYSATCSGTNNYGGLAINAYLHSGESVQVLPSGTDYGFY